MLRALTLSPNKHFMLRALTLSPSKHFMLRALTLSPNKHFMSRALTLSSRTITHIPAVWYRNYATVACCSALHILCCPLEGAIDKQCLRK
jgi:hypothetical protein